MTDTWFGPDLDRLAELLSEEKHCQDEQANCTEHVAQCGQAERKALRNGEDPTWVRELAQEYTARVENACARLDELRQDIREEISRLDNLTSYSLKMQMNLARFLDDHGRDGAAIAERAVMLAPQSSDQALTLSSYLRTKGRYAAAVTAARQGWQRFGDRVLQAQWLELLEQVGPLDDLIDLLNDNLRAAPDDLGLMERLVCHLLRADRIADAYDMMVRALAHPAGGHRLLASFMVALVKNGEPDRAVGLSRHYLAGVQNRLVVCRELAETLRRDGYLATAVAMLDTQVEAEPDDVDLAGYRASFLVNTARNDQPAIRKAGLALLQSRRDREVERQLQLLFDGARGDELRLSVLDSLAIIKGQQALPFLKQALVSDARRVRIAAARAIGRLAQPEGGTAALPVAEPGGPPVLQPEQYRVAARKLLAGRLVKETDDAVRQALVDALHQVDPRPRRAWERPLGLRPWAESAPLAPPPPDPARRRRQSWTVAATLCVVALAALYVAPIDPSPRAMAERYWGQAYGMVGTRIAHRLATSTPPPSPVPSATRPPARADQASGQVGEVAAADTARVQLAGQIATVRYIGIEVPASGQPGARAALDANRSLVAARLVYLETGKIPQDSSGRWWRYVWLPEGQMASERLLELGFAAPAADPTDTKYQPRLADAATKAWKNKAGFWHGGTDVFPMAAIKSPEANVREGPGTNQPVKLQVKQGAVFVVVGRNRSSDWVAVKIPGNVVGWISIQVADTTLPAASLPLAPQ